nr:ribonuclease H-like domain-containing protein [Tanacetum cinerariifolium]
MKYELWRMRMEQYIQMVDYSLWEVIENGNTANIDNLSDAVICAFLASQPSSPQLLNLNGNETVAFDKTKVKCYNFHKRGHFAKECRAPRAQDNKNRESTRMNVPVKTTNSTAFVSCDGFGGYDWSDQVEEGPNYALMAYSTSSTDYEVSTDSFCLKTCLKTVETLKSQNEQMLKDLRTSKINVITYKTGLESVKARLLVYKKNEYVYEDDIKLLKRKFFLKDIAITELRRKLKLAHKQKDVIQLTVENFENSSKSLSKLLESQIADNCKAGLGYNAISPPYTENFLPPKPNLSGLQEFKNVSIVSETTDKNLVVETSKAKACEDKPKVVKNNCGLPIIEDWKSEYEVESVPQPKIEKKTVKPSFSKIDFVKSKEQVKSPRKTTVKQDEKPRQHTHKPKGNQRNWNNLMSQRLKSNFEMYNKACYECVNAARQKFSKAAVTVNTTRLINTAHPKTTMNAAKPRPKAVVNTARPKAVLNIVTGNEFYAVKASAYYKKLMEDMLPLEFWTTAKAKNINEEAQIHIKVDGKKVIISEASIRRDLRFGDEERIDCFSNEVIFKQLTLMG